MIQRAALVETSKAIIDVVAVADIQFRLGAISPDRVLNKPRERLWVGCIELPGVNSPCERSYYVGASIFRIASRSVGVVDTKPRRNARSAEKIVNECVDSDHAHTGFKPQRLARWRGQKNLGESHIEYLVRHSVNIAERLDQSPPHPFVALSTLTEIRVSKGSIYPIDKMPIGDIADKEEQ